jgi:hypothetical protein
MMMTEKFVANVCSYDIRRILKMRILISIPYSSPFYIVFAFKAGEYAETYAQNRRVAILLQILFRERN